MAHISAILFVVIICVGCSRETGGDQVAEETVVVARRHGVDYVATLAKAKAGDVEAVRTLLDLSDHVDAAAALGHGVALVDLSVALTDQRFATLVQDASQARRQLLAELFEAGFDYHPKYRHADPLKVLPSTYAALNAR
jgi:hypothetical protein